MRRSFAQAVVSKHNQNDCFFLTGDLGFMALENVKASCGDRFINAGVAEQNMVGVAAGLAREGYKVFVYSIAPFCYARPFEQIRNDICLANLPVCLVGNGGGYAYGTMGPTHHALEDCAVMNSLGIRVLVPAFDEDIPEMISHISKPTYLRLGYDVRPEGTTIGAYSSWREVLEGKRGAIAALGPLAGVAWRALLDTPITDRPSVWAVSEFVEDEIPEGFWNQADGKTLFVMEEHVVAGGLGMHMAFAMVRKGVQVHGFVHRHATGYPNGRFGSQEFHRDQSGLNAKGVLSMLSEVSP
uniref:Transketolase n=1 Tax=Candidatus Kentrum sp. LPFa TaxID=2126335 RepID=A0A450X8V5_9GAMM|nr:MAG: transketolase [Candidatus Kentron sp. LPFa]VFK25774.1 MAG: transketolase [Candidatus Kentron sp. LPFa]